MSSRGLVEIVVPVYNEEHVLEQSIGRLHRFLEQNFPFPWRIVIADNASTDATHAVAERLATELPAVAVLHLPVKGRGRALRAAWSGSEADVVAYMDVDLSTDLRALLPLVAPLVSGHSDVAIGSRLARGARVERSAKRELISRAYNQILHALLRAKFSDAQCGFKAIRTEVARELVPEVRDNGWFFDTELLVLAERRGLRIHEVPVDWVEDPDSRVDIVQTALTDLRGVERLLLASPPVRFVAVGIASTVAYASLYLLLRTLLVAAEANALALALTAVANGAANRRLTFRVRGRDGLVGDHALSAVLFLFALGLTTGALAGLAEFASHPSRAVQVTVLIAASACATLIRYVWLRRWFLRSRGSAIQTSAPPPGRLRAPA